MSASPWVSKPLKLPGRRKVVLRRKKASRQARIAGAGARQERAADSRSDAALRRQKALAEFAVYALREREKIRVIDRATALVAETLNVDFGTALELEPDGREFRIVAGHNWPRHRLGARISAGPDTQAGHALELYRRSSSKTLDAPQPVVIEDLPADGRFGHTFWVRELGVISAVCVVIPGVERPFGMIAAHSRTRRQFEPVEIEFMQAVANVLAAGLSRSSKGLAEFRESEARFRRLTALSSDWFWEQDAELRFTFVSEEFFRKSGMLREQVLGKRRWEFPDAQPPGGSWDAHRAVLEARLSFRDFEFARVAPADGTLRYQSISGEPVFDADGHFSGYRGTGRDTTVSRRIEQELRTRAEGDRALIELGLIASREEDAKALLERAVEIVARALGVEFAKVLELLPDRSGLRLVAGTGWKPGTVGHALVDAGLDSQAGYTIHEYERSAQAGGERFAPVIVTDLASEPRFRGPELLTEHGVVSGMSVVIPGPVRAWGVLGVHSRSPRVFESRDADFLQAAANLISAALDRCRTHAELKESEAQLRAFMDHSSLSMFIKDREGRYQHVNAQFLRNFGFAAEQVLGRTTADVFPRQQAEAFSDHDARVRDTRAPVMEEGEVRYADGVHVALANKYPILDERGEVVGIGGVVADITDRKRIEQALRDSRQLLARAQELAGLGYWECDAATRVVRGSRGLRRMFGTGDHLPPQSLEWCLSLIHPEDRERVRAAVRLLLEQSLPFDLEARVTTPAGVEKVVLITAETVRGDAGRVAKVIGTCLEITEQRRREGDLCAAAEQLQALSRRLVQAEESERRRIASELHDRVGQNLTAVSINLQMVSNRGSGLDADSRRRLQDSLRLLDATASCVEGVLVDLRPPMLDDWGLGATLRWVGEEFSRRTEIPVRVHELGNERRMRSETEIALLRIVQEALNNVAKHANARHVEITLGWEAEAVRVEVADDGRGFERPASGRESGLGILTMRERVQAATGLLNIDSAPGRGTRVRALIPR